MAREIRKAQYYVEYLGWKETTGLYGKEFTEPIARQLLLRTRHASLPRLTVGVSRKRVAITQDVTAKKTKPEKLSYPPVHARDVTFVAQCSAPDADVAACIFLGYNPMTQCAAHVHVYRFDTPSTASIFVDHVKQIVSIPEHKQRIADVEADLAALGYIARRRGSSAGGGGPTADAATAPRTPAPDYAAPAPQQPPPSAGPGRYSRELPKQQPLPPPPLLLHSRSVGSIATATTAAAAIDADQSESRQPFSSLQEELDYKLKVSAPILLPPKDYDTVLRRHGKIGDRDAKRSTHAAIIGPNGLFAQPRAEPYCAAIREEERSSSSSDAASAGDDEPASATATADGGGPPPLSDEVIPAWKTKQGMEYRPPSVSLQRSVSSGDSYAADASRKSTPRDAEPADDGPYADGLYTGYANRSAKGGSGSSGGARPASSELVMWSYDYSYGHDASSKGPPEGAHSAEDDYLARTAPPAFLHRNLPPHDATPRPDYRQPQQKHAGLRKEPAKNSSYM